jgi:RNA ligase
MSDETERMQDRWLWPHLENIERIRAERETWFDPDATWVITEKIHGFNARFGLDLDGTPWVGTRNNVIFEGDPAAWPREAQQGFVGFAADHVKELIVGMTLFGEWAGKGVQKGIDYGEKDFYAFGMMMLDALIYWDVLVDECHIRGIKTVPVLYRGKGLPPIETLNEWREGTSLIATTQREGICITQDPPVRDGWGHYLIGKFKAAAFAENARAQKPLRELPDMANLLNFVNDYATPMRLQHVLDQVGETLTNSQGNGPLAVESTGDVLRTMYQDVVREAGTEYEALSDEDKKMLGKVLSSATKKLLDAARLENLAKG